MPAIAGLIFCIPVLQKEAGLFIALLLQIMQQDRIGVARQLLRQFLDSCEKRKQTRFWFGRRHGFHRAIQFRERIQQILF